MDKEFWKGFMRFLDQATLEEIDKRYLEIEAYLPKVTEKDLRSDMRRCLRLLNEERVARTALIQRKRAQKPN